MNPKRRYIVSGDEEKTYLSDEDFVHYYRINKKVEEVSFNCSIHTKMIQNGIHYFKYKNFSKEIDVGLYGVPYCLGSLISDSRVGDFPDYLRDVSQFYKVFSECNSYSSSGIYDMEEKRILFQGLRMADLGNIYIENKGVQECSNNLTGLYEWALSNSIPLVAIGGDHLLTYAIQSVLNNLKQEKIVVIIFDAHHDCKNSILESNQVNHANFVNELLEFNNIEKIIQIGVRGIRSLSNIVFHDKLIQYRGLQDIVDLKKELSLCKRCKIYLSIDLDVIDPALYPCVDFIIPGGFTMNTLKIFLKTIFEENLELIGCDLVEGLPEKNSQHVQVPISILSILLDCINHRSY